MTRVTDDEDDAYHHAGVSIARGDALVERIKPFARGTARPGTTAALGGFGGLFDLKAAGYIDPILVASNDGVGTKVKIAIETGQHDTIGIDLVAMCANDVAVQGAHPLFFLDYFACGRLDVDVAAGVVAGVAEGCRMAGAALIGGETAEMPGIYVDGDYDLAGFCVGAAERGSLLPRETIAPGDVLIGVASSGLHSNGFSLVRKIVSSIGANLAAPAPFDQSVNLGTALLTPTRIYVPAMMRAHTAGYVKAFAHITGGGLPGNVPRVLPDTARAVIDLSQIPVPRVFGWLAGQGGVGEAALLKTFNCGVGLVAVVAPDVADALIETFAACGETAFRIGFIEARDPAAPAIRFTGAPRLRP